LKNVIDGSNGVFELFIGWAALITGWVIISEFAALWVVWLILLNTGVILYWDQVGGPAHSIRYEYLCLAAAALNALALFLREVGVKRGLGWLNGRWLRGLLLAAVLAALSFPAIGLIVDFERATLATALAASAWAATALGGYVCYRRGIPDMPSLALIVLNGCIVLLTFIGKLLLSHERFYGAASFVILLFSVIILVVASAAAFWLKKTAAAMAEEMKEASE
jgi:hypothetical protein